MNDIKDGGPAFPALGRWGDGPAPQSALQQDGMTLCDYFAAKAMQGLIGGDWPTAKSEQNQLALLAYSLANAMLRAREEK